MKYPGEHHHHTPYGAQPGLFTAAPLGNNGLPVGRVDGGFQPVREHKPFSSEVLSVRSGHGRDSRASRPVGSDATGVEGADQIHPVAQALRDPLYMPPSQRNDFGYKVKSPAGKLMFPHTHGQGSLVGDLMGQGPPTSSAPLHVVSGWGPTTRIRRDDGDGLSTNRSTSRLGGHGDHDVRCGPLENNILYGGGLHRADRGVRVGYGERNPKNPTGQHSAPYHVQLPANSRADDAGDSSQADQVQAALSAAADVSDRIKAGVQSPVFPPREIGHLVPVARNVRKTPAGLGGAPRNPSPLSGADRRRGAQGLAGAPLDDIAVPEAPGWMSVQAARLLNTLQHGLPPFYHHLGNPYNKAELIRVVRLSGVHHRATQFESCMEEVWQMLDPDGKGLVDFDHGINVLKLREMTKKWDPADRNAGLYGVSPYDRDAKLPSHYWTGNQTLADPKWRQKQGRREREQAKLDALVTLKDLAPGEGLYHRNKEREALQDALIDSRPSLESKAHISSVQANRAWRMRNQEAIENDIFSSASAAASRRNSSVRSSAPGGCSSVSSTPFGASNASVDVAAPSLGPSQLRPGEIFGPNFYAHRTPQLRQTLEEASYHQQVERQQARHGGGGPPPVTIRAREARGKSFGGGAYQAEMLKHQHDGVYLQSEPPCSRADAYKKSSNPSTSDFPLRPSGHWQQPRSEHAGGGVTAEQLDQHGFPLRDARSQRQHWQNDPLYNGATSLAARDILVSHPGSRDPGK